MRAVFVDADDNLAAIAETLLREGDPAVAINRDPDVTPDALPAVLGDTEIAIIDHTPLPTPLAAKCRGLAHVVFLGTGARSYMNPEEFDGLGITVHIIKGHGDTAVAESAIALMWASARGLACMDREMRAGHWLGIEGVQLTGKTLGLVGFGGIAAEVARLALGCGLKVIAWNRSRLAYRGVEFAALDEVLARSDVVSLHLLLTEEIRGFLSRRRFLRRNSRCRANGSQVQPAPRDLRSGCFLGVRRTQPRSGKAGSSTLLPKRKGLLGSLRGFDLNCRPLLAGSLWCRPKCFAATAGGWGNAKSSGT